MKFIFNNLNINLIKFYNKNIVYINNNNKDIINKYRKINRDKLEIKLFKIRYKNIILYLKKLL